MNTIYFSGDLYKKYQAADVQQAICDYAAEQGLTVTCPEETKTVVDFGIKTEGFCFTIEDQSLIRQVVKHEVDDEKRYRLIYELLYRIRKFFKMYEVTDDSGIWANVCYEKEPVHILMRELTKEEREIGEHLDFSGYSQPCQIFLGIIELFIWDKGPFKEEVLGDWNTMVQKIRREDLRRLPFWLYGIIENWIYYCMDFQGKPVPEYPENHGKLGKAMTAAVNAFSFYLIGFGCPAATKLGKDISVFFEYEDQKQKRETGLELAETFESAYRYTLSALEYLGFTIREQPNFPDKKLDISCFDYWALV